MKPLFAHLRIKHGLREDPLLNLKCCVKSCFLNFKTYSGLRKHLLKHMELSNIETDDSSDLDINQPSTSFNEACINESIEDCESDGKKLENYEIDSENISYHFSNFMYTILSLPISLSDKQCIFTSSSEFLQSILELTESEIIKSQSNTSDASKIINRNKTLLQTEFRNCSSIYKITKHLQYNMIKPKQIVIGHRNEQKLNKDGKYYQHVVPSTFVYVPILETLKHLLNKNSILKSYLESAKNNSEYLYGISDGCYAKGIYELMAKKYVIEIQIYFDEFETTNPIGSKTGIHKMGAFYFTLTNVPQYLNSNLNNIFLLALAYTADIKQYNVNSVLKPIIDDIKILEKDGIFIDVLSDKVYGTIFSLSHDNLGANLLHGMVESFSATYFCRVCMMTKAETQTSTLENPNMLRNNDLYKLHCNESVDGNTSYGIKRSIVLDDLMYFKLYNSISVDVMHDLLEGAVQMEIKLILNYFIEKKFITLENINNRIKSFNYGILHATDRPSIVMLDKSGHSIGQKACQTWCLMRFLPLILFDIIESNPSEEWNVIVLLMKITGIVLAPRINLTMISELKLLISDHHQKFQACFKQKLLPKHHFMTHYPRIINMFGPLINLWCMRYEVKHGYFKNLAAKYRNYKNLAVTLANRHQEMFSNVQYCYNQGLECGPLQQIEFKSYCYKDIIINQLEIFEDNFLLKIPSWAKLGFFYKRRFFIYDHQNNNLPVFNEIIDIVLIDSSLFFVCQEWQTLKVVENLCSFEVQRNNSSPLKFVCLNSCYYKEPFEVHQPYGSQQTIITPKYVLC